MKDWNTAAGYSHSHVSFFVSRRQVLCIAINCTLSQTSFCHDPHSQGSLEQSKFTGYFPDSAISSGFCEYTLTP